MSYLSYHGRETEVPEWKSRDGCKMRSEEVQPVQASAIEAALACRVHQPTMQNSAPAAAPYSHGEHWLPQAIEPVGQGSQTPDAFTKL